MEKNCRVAVLGRHSKNPKTHAQAIPEIFFNLFVLNLHADWLKLFSPMIVHR